MVLVYWLPRKRAVATHMARGKIEIGDEVLVRATVTMVWNNGNFTVLIKGAGQRVTLQSLSDIEPVNGVPPQPKKRKGERSAELKGKHDPGISYRAEWIKAGSPGTFVEWFTANRDQFSRGRDDDQTDFYQRA